MNVLGVDACGKQGWAGIRLTDGAYAGSLTDLRLGRLIERAAEVDAIAVDMPLGLVEKGWRGADVHDFVYRSIPAPDLTIEQVASGSVSAMRGGR
ncbi:DUF429 domain-containing protein [Streptomyces sp. NPDC059224]|uniref:DUF429 domain-containing protein n=1 Tax=Streptomyces sp. NPDC059224 TaxID=3346775 RepID=UPI003682314E